MGGNNGRVKCFWSVRCCYFFVLEENKWGSSNLRVTLNAHMYILPAIGSSTGRLEKQQCPIRSCPPPSSFPCVTAPHCTGSKLASTSCGGAWQAALIAAELLATSGMPAGYHSWLNTTPPRAMTLATTAVKMIATGEYPHVEISPTTSLVCVSVIAICTLNKLCDASQ